MTNENSIRFTLEDNTDVIVKKVTNNKYDFELILSNGNRKTFVWTYGASVAFIDKKGNIDNLITEAVQKFSIDILHNQLVSMFCGKLQIILFDLLNHL